MLFKLLGALLRGACVVLVFVTPALALPATTEDVAQMATLVALALGLFTAVEYGAASPALIGFRDAPPFNRVRIVALLAILLCLSLVAGGAGSGTALLPLLQGLGLWVAQVLELPFRPLVPLFDTLARPADPAIAAAPALSAEQVRAMAGLAVLGALSAVATFALLVRLQRWPGRGQAFNVWVNLPTFDPTQGGDIVARLRRGAFVNGMLGIAATCVAPTIGVMVADRVDPHWLAAPHGVVWGISLWMFAPLSLLMRGLAMARVAALIRDRRARLVAGVSADAPLNA